MSKKTFINKGGFDSLLDDTYSYDKKTDINIGQQKKPDTFKKVTIRLKTEIANSVKEIAYWNRISITEFIERALIKTIEEEQNKKNQH